MLSNHDKIYVLIVITEMLQTFSHKMYIVATYSSSVTDS